VVDEAGEEGAVTAYGYARASREDQELALQIDALTAAGVEPGCLIQEKLSGVVERLHFAKLLASLETGDTLVVWKVDRLGRNAVDVQRIVRELDQRGIQLVITTLGIDTKAPVGRLVFGILSQLAEFERELLMERTRAGLEAARRRGKRMGRKPQLTVMQARQAAQMVADGMSYGEIADTMNVSRSCVWRAVQRAAAKLGQ
jgi:Enterobacteriaceae phage serine recombinase